METALIVIAFALCIIAVELSILAGSQVFRRG